MIGLQGRGKGFNSDVSPPVRVCRPDVAKPRRGSIAAVAPAGFRAAAGRGNAAAFERPWPRWLSPQETKEPKFFVVLVCFWESFRKHPCRCDGCHRRARALAFQVAFG